MDDLFEALALLDPEDDEHWTADGAPRIDAVSDILGRAVTRKQIIDIAPLFTRDGSLVESQSETAAVECGGDATSGSDADPAPKLSPEAMRYLEVSDEISRLHYEKGEIEVRIDRLAREHASLERHSPYPLARGHKEDQAARMRFIKSQQAQRQQSVISRAQKELASAPIDTAMARKNSRGAKRPRYPAKSSMKG